MTDERTSSLDTVFRQILGWGLPAVVTVLCLVVVGNHNLVTAHAGKFDGIWNESFHAAIDEVIEYVSVHEAYRELYVIQDAQFKEDVRKFMAAGGRFSADQAEKMEARWEARCDARYKTHERRLWRIEQELTALRARKGEGHTHIGDGES